MIDSYLLCKSPITGDYTHVICIDPVIIYELPDFKIVSGDNNPLLFKKAICWFVNQEFGDKLNYKLRPSNFEESLIIVRRFRSKFNFTNLSDRTGISERYLTRCIDGVVKNGKPLVIPKALRDKFIMAVFEYELSNYQS